MRNKKKKPWADARRDSTLKYLYGITLEDYTRMLDDQHGVCAICSQPNVRGWRLSVDHNHETGEVRALLCNPCNFALAQYEKYPEEFLGYIEDH